MECPRYRAVVIGVPYEVDITEVRSEWKLLIPRRVQRWYERAMGAYGVPDDGTGSHSSVLGLPLTEDVVVIPVFGVVSKRVPLREGEWAMGEAGCHINALTA